jgi:hypothetical protein
MLKAFAAFALLTAPAAISTAQSPTPIAQWTLAGGQQGCAVHASSPQGTVVSIIAGTEQSNLMFLLQNRNWRLKDGERYPIAVEFDEEGPWQLQAIARTEIDQDGPGLLFSVPPGDERGLKFITEFVGASGMQLSREGAGNAAIPLGSGQSAMTALAQCLGQMFEGGASPNVTEAGFGGGRAVKI